MKIHNKKHITMTPDDVRKAIERYIDDEIISAETGCDIKFIVHDIYQKDSLTKHYTSEFAGAEVTIHHDRRV
jgi:hypothetical protein